ncbi:MAG: serine/threonine protein kinase [Candidatus Obscuribacter phosphatis]|uniref:non-specific serine/threonine protein kinase n=1 Tax=Candidatus Obscuribacter phosphatis TaxID=1906157 RepID=A0A8J7PFI1_9BACT|nr:serine/threonine protein kinase [Candidatus Obscuribacter phosphatis]
MTSENYSNTEASSPSQAGNANTALTLLGDEVLLDLAGPKDRFLFDFLLFILPLWLFLIVFLAAASFKLGIVVFGILASLAFFIVPIVLLHIFNLKLGFMKGQINLPGIIPGTVKYSDIKAIKLEKVKHPAGMQRVLNFTVQGQGDSLEKISVSIENLTIESAKLLWHCLAKNCKNSEIDFALRQSLNDWGSAEQDSLSKAYSLLGIEPGKESDRDLSIELNLSRLKMRNSYFDYLSSPFQFFIRSWTVLWLFTFAIIFSGLHEVPLVQTLLWAFSAPILGLFFLVSSLQALGVAWLPTAIAIRLLGLVGLVLVTKEGIAHIQKLNQAIDQIYIDYLGITSRTKTKTGYLPLSYIQWKHLQKVTVEGKGRANRALVFTPDTEGKAKISVPLYSLNDSKAIEKLFEALKVWAPESAIEPDLFKELGQDVGGSFTELWLSSLSSAPALEALTPLTPGARLEGRPYQIESLLGSGGQGVTYLLKSTETAKTYVLKEIILPSRTGYLMKEKLLQDFEKQSRLLARVKHDRIAGLKESFVHDGRAYLLMDFVEGESLFDHILDKRISDSSGSSEAFELEQTVKFAISLCEILEYLHGLEPPVIHRDFTPHNLILDKDGKLNLIDFGVALESSETTALQKANIVGKQSYMPIEQLRGQVDQSCDIYALGGCIYFMLTGLEPEPLSDLSKAKELADPKYADLLPILAGCTAQEAENRFKSAGQCKESLQNWLTARAG